MILRKINNINNNGFTLAEVLITLVIIGVIAAMTIPTLMKNTQNQEFVSGLKKAESVLKQAMMMIAQNNDAPPGDYSFINNIDFIDEFVQVTNVVKKCNTTAACFGSVSSYKTLNNNDVGLSDGKSAITSDGQMFTFAPSISTKYGLSSEDENNLMGRIVVDLNGNKGPNRYGRDVYFFYVVNEKGIVAAGSNNYSDCQKNGQGGTCATRVLVENAMNY